MAFDDVITRFGGSIFAREESLMAVSTGSIFGKSVAKAIDDDDNEIFGFIHNPGNTISTIFGVPVGTQFGTAMGMEGFGALAFDILTDPTTWLSVGGILLPEPGTTAAGVAGLSSVLAKHGLKFSQFGVKAGRLKKAYKFLDGATVEAKTKALASAFETAAKAKESPELVQKILKAAQEGRTTDMFKFIDEFKATGTKGTSFKLGSLDDGTDLIFDLDRTLKTGGFNQLREAFDLEKTLSSGFMKATNESKDLILNETISAMRYGFVGPKFLSKGVDVLNHLPGVETLAKTTNIVGDTVTAGLSKGFELTGLQSTAKNVMDGVYKHHALISAAKAINGTVDEIIPRIEFMDNSGIIKLNENGAVVAQQHPGLFNFTNRIFKSEVDALSSLGDAAANLSNRILGMRSHAEMLGASKINQLVKVGGEKSGLRNTTEQFILRTFGSKKRKEMINNYSILKQDETFDDQTRVLEVMLQTDGVPLNELHRYAPGGDLAKTERARLIQQRLPGIHRSRQFADDAKFAPTPETQKAFEILRQQNSLIADMAESVGLPVYTVSKAVAGMSEEQIRHLKPDDVFKALRSEEGGVMFSPHAGFADPNRVTVIERELARDKAFQELADPNNSRITDISQIESRADEIVTMKDPIHLAARDETFSMLRAQSGMHQHATGNFHREVNLLGYAADPLSRDFSSGEFYSKWASYYSGISRSISDHASLTQVVRRVRADEYAEILRRQGISEEDIGTVIQRAGSEDGFFDVMAADDLIDKIVSEVGDVRAGAYARQVVEHYLGKHIRKDSLPWQLTAQANKYQIATKLTAVMSALTNLGQTANVLIDSGYFTAAKAARLAMEDLVSGVPAIADEVGTIAHNSVKDLDEGLKAFGGFTDAVLEGYGFSTIERFNRRMSTYAGLLTAEAMEKASGKATSKRGWESFWGRYGKTTDRVAKVYEDPRKMAEQLRKSGLPRNAKEAGIQNAPLRDMPNTPAGRQFVSENAVRDVDTILKQMKDGTFEGFTHAEVKRIATETVNAQQFRTSAIDVAEAFNNPLGSFVGIFMKFQFKQSEFFVKKVAKPGVQWIKTGGKSGNIQPLLIALSPVGAPVVGEVLNDIKAALNDRDRPDDISERLWENYLAIGGAGFFSSVADAFVPNYNPFKAKQLAGANLNDVKKFMSAAGTFVTEGEDDQFYDELMKDITHPLPLQLRRGARSFFRGLRDPKSEQTMLEYERVRYNQGQDMIQAAEIDLSGEPFQGTQATQGGQISPATPRDRTFTPVAPQFQFGSQGGPRTAREDLQEEQARIRRDAGFGF